MEANMKATLEDVRDFILHAGKNELELLSSILQSRWKHLNALTSLTFNRGDHVYWIHGKRVPTRFNAVVHHSDGKWVYVLSPNVRSAPNQEWNYKVSPLLLKKV